MLRLLAILVLFFASSPFAQAASLYLDPGLVTINRGDAVSIALRVAPDEQSGECINSIDGIITYDASIQPVDISLGDSIFSMWVEQPVIDPEKRTITLAGGIPNGYCGRIVGDPRLSNVVAEFIFRSPGFQIGGGDQADSATIAISPESKVYLNDGQGTVAPLRTFNATIALSKTPGPGIVDPWRESVAGDTIPPQEFSISLERDATAFAQNYYIAFNTTDKETGLSHYEVIEEPLSEFTSFAWGRADALWVRTKSPYVLKDQSLNSTIRVKALDKAGNEYIATLLPDQSLRTMSQERITRYLLLGSVLLIIVSVLIVGALFVIRRRARRRTEGVTVESTTS